MTDLRRKVAQHIQASLTCTLQDYDIDIETITGDVELFEVCLVTADAVLAEVAASNTKEQDDAD